LSFQGTENTLDPKSDRVKKTKGSQNEIFVGSERGAKKEKMKKSEGEKKKTARETGKTM